MRGADNKLCEGLQTILGFGCFFFFLKMGRKPLESVGRGVIQVCKDFLAALWRRDIAGQRVK